MNEVENEEIDGIINDTNSILDPSLKVYSRNFDSSKDTGFIAHSMAQIIMRIPPYSYTPKENFYAHMRPAIDKMLADEQAIKTIFYFEIDGEESYLGFTVVKRDRGIFAYIKPTYRGLGFYKSLKPALDGVKYSCFSTPKTNRMVRGYKCDPFFFFKEYL